MFRNKRLAFSYLYRRIFLTVPSRSRVFATFDYLKTNTRFVLTPEESVGSGNSNRNILFERTLRFFVISGVECKLKRELIPCTEQYPERGLYLTPHTSTVWFFLLNIRHTDRRLSCRGICSPIVKLKY